MQYGLWWDRPDIRNDIEKIIIREVEFPPRSSEYTHATRTLEPESPEFQKIIKAVGSGWKNESMVILKIPSYTVEITYTDGSKTKVEVFGNFMRIKSQGVFRSLRNVSEIIKAELKTTE
jgi:hypothetical protein